MRSGLFILGCLGCGAAQWNAPYETNYHRGRYLKLRIRVDIGATATGPGIDKIRATPHLKDLGGRNSSGCVMIQNKKIETKTSPECARRLMSLFAKLDRINQHASVGYLVAHFRGRGFAHEEYRRAVAYALARKWIAFPPDNSVALTPLGASMLSKRGIPTAASGLSTSDAHRS